MYSKKQIINYQMFAKPVFDLVNYYRSGKLELNPAFQRQSVWKLADRKKLIDSMMRGYPVPAIVLYKRPTSAGVVFDVIDGKQRLESILKFMGEIRGEQFSAAVELFDPITGESATDSINWKSLVKRGMQDHIERFVFPVIEVEGEMSEIFNLFVRINSTGKPLSPQEKRKAIYYNSPLLHEADKVARKFEKYFVTEMSVLSAAQIDRMKHVELVCELMLSLVNGNVLQKKEALNRALNTKGFDNRQLAKASRLVVSALNGVKKVFPDLRETRFRKLSDFYTLVVLIGQFQQQDLILINKQRNRIAWELLRRFGAGVDEVRVLKRTTKGLRRDQELFHRYWLTVVESTDEINQRKQRLEILRGLLGSIFERKDANRVFSEEQRRILWSTADVRQCAVSGCTTKLTWDDFTIDHISPHSKGGRTALANAAIMCRSHNSAKGNRRVKKTGAMTRSAKSRTKNTVRQENSRKRNL